MAINNGPKIVTMVSAQNGDTYGDGERHQLRTQQALIQANVISVGVNTPPITPGPGNNGFTYVVGTVPLLGWSGQANAIAYSATDPQDGPSITPSIATGAWEFYTPLAGWHVYDNATGLTWKFNGTIWLWDKQVGTAQLTAASSVAVPFTATYAGPNAPIVTVEPVGGDPTAVGAVWVTNTGAPNAWTGFTINVHTLGTQTFNYAVAG